MTLHDPKTLYRLYVGTAFLEGTSVLIIEIAGARALAPFYGSSLKVWTAQITATLLFLAIGYWVGGKVSRRQGNLGLPLVFLSAGFWLVLFPFLRTVVLESTSAFLGISGGSFLGAVILYGPPLLALGAVSPLLIERQDRLDAGAGRAAGTIFFTNTMGGLVGGWLTALVLIPHMSLRIVLAATGVVLLVLGSFWGLAGRSDRPLVKAAAVLVILSAAGLSLYMMPGPERNIRVSGFPAKILYTRNSSVGLIQVLDIPAIQTRSLLLDGAVQGGVTRGLSAYPFTEYQNFLAHRFHPRAQSALLLGLGAGVLASQLVDRGLDVTAVELEPRIGEVARTYFALPDSVRVYYEDARTYLNRTRDRFDVVFLDVFAAENTPWYMMTVESIERIGRVLNPGGILVINTIAWVEGASPDVVRLESALLQVFDEAGVFVSQQGEGEAGRQVTNGVLVAGSNLSPTPDPFPGQVLPFVRLKLEAMAKTMRPAMATVAPPTDDFNDYDYAGADIRLALRRILIADMGADVLGD
ncbi:MAG: fused MFS/spermidine synthase [Desulfococcus multivorans]|jgi:spermidine synthase|nr:fused MFS/spermidine synthase [Desulfococcus multivorans]